MESLLHKHNLNSFEALWSLELQAVDEPNKQRGGHSTVFYLELDGQGFYLNRQVNYFTRTLRKPLGEPTFAREFCMIGRFKDLNIPALQAAYFSQRRVAGRCKAILITYALQG